LKRGRARKTRGGRAVAILTGSGLKDPDTAMKQPSAPVIEAPATVEGIERALGW
jgi:threonine synthase